MNNGKFDFENFKVYQRSFENTCFVYKVKKDFPKAEIFSLIDHFKRAPISICLNIEVGSGGSKCLRTTNSKL
jgi:four helix bundle protein